MTDGRTDGRIRFFELNGLNIVFGAKYLSEWPWLRERLGYFEDFALSSLRAWPYMLDSTTFKQLRISSVVFITTTTVVSELLYYC